MEKDFSYTQSERPNLQRKVEELCQFQPHADHRNHFTNISEVFKRLNDTTLCSEQLNLNWNLKNNFRKPNRILLQKGRKTTKLKTLIYDFKKLEVVLINVQHGRQVFNQSSLKAASRWYINKSSFQFKNPVAPALRFMTQVPPYFSLSHIPGTKIVSSVQVTIIYQMITFYTSIHIYTHIHTYTHTHTYGLGSAGLTV